MKRLCVFCGSSVGDDPAFAEAAEAVGGALAERRITLVYGGGNVGLMGVLADAALRAGGEVIGVIPKALMEWEVGHLGLSDLRVVDSMHERKALMAELSDGFAALPGGIGTLEEFFEIWTWAQLGVHHKPCGLLNAKGYYDPLVVFLDAMVERGFLKPRHRSMAIVEREVGPLLAALEVYRPPEGEPRLNGRRT
ncbi:MAG: TIGR00730 family Rossman fold protein [Acidobacteriota bacterium]